MYITEIIDFGKSPFDSKIIWFELLCDRLKTQQKRFFIYGASKVTSSLLSLFFDKQLMPCCLCDSDENKWSTRISSIKIVSPEDAVKAYPDAVCVIAVRAAGAHFDAISKRLESLGCTDYYVLNWERCPRESIPELIEDVQKNKDSLIRCRDLFHDEPSKTRFDSFICAYLSSYVCETSSPVIGQYKALDGHILENDIITITPKDVLVSCRCGLDRNNAAFLKYARTAKRAHLLEPCISSRTVTAEGTEKDSYILIYPYIAGEKSGEYVSFNERICFKGYIDFLEYSQSQARQKAIDDLGITDASVLYFDIGENYKGVLRGAEKTIENGVRAIVITGFQRPGDVIEIIEKKSGWKYGFRYFGGQDMREGYALIAIKCD